MTGIDVTIQQVEQLYRAVTGKDIPPPPNGDQPNTIPPEREPVQFVSEQIDRLVDLLGQRPGETPAPEARPLWQPPATIWEENEEIRVALDVPGIRRDAIQITLTGGSLLIRGQRPAPWKGPEASTRAWAVERPYGAFQRVVPLPPGTQPDQVTAELSEGVLEIRIARSPGTPGVAQTIPVK
jgi:HSP20 family protein